MAVLPVEQSTEMFKKSTTLSTLVVLSEEGLDQQIICPFIDSKIESYVQKFVNQGLGQDGWTIGNY